jgi:hypothetical protein
MNTVSLSRIALIALVSCLFVSAQQATAASYYVSPSGNDSKAGTLSAPLATITNAYSKAHAGDVIYLRGGVYRQQVTLTGVSGASSNPVTLSAYGQEVPIISGLDVLKLTWTKSTNTAATNNAVVYMATYTAATNSDFTNPVTPTIYQLFYNGKPMLPARWPNCPTNADGSWNFFATNTWAVVNTNGNSYGTVADSDLSTLRSSINGAMAVLNVSHQFYTWTRAATNHTAGGTTFNYSQDLSGVATNQSFDDNRYYLFGQKQFLDAPGEWYYDGTNKLYFMTPDGTSPTNGVVEIKTRPFGFTADANSSYLTVQGITFFGTAFKFGSYGNKSSSITLSSNTVTQSSWTEYLTVNSGTNGAIQDTYFPTIWADNCQILNNTFTYGALTALQIHGFRNVIENNSFSDFDYSSSLVYPPLYVNLAYPALTNTAGNAVVRYNSLMRSGGIQLQFGQGTNDVYLNDVTDSFLACYGGNIDTAAIYFNNYFITGSRVHHNWVQGGYAGTPPQAWGGGLGIRGDDYTCGVTVDHNVTWDLGGGGIQLKNTNNPSVANANQCINNTVFADSVYNNGTNSAIIISTSDLTNENSNSIVVNNLATAIRGSWSATPLGTVALNASNATSTNPDVLLVSASTNPSATWFDFRPLSNSTTLINKGSTNSLIITNLPGIASCTNWPIINTNGTGAPDVGAYERGDTVYWIPGQRLAKASAPIIPDQQTNVPSASRDALMWKPAYGASSHKCYFSSSKMDVLLGSSRAYKGTFTGENNVCTLPALSAGTTYYWRVDAVVNGAVVKGDVWTFKTQ